MHPNKKILFLFHGNTNWYNIEYLYQRCLKDTQLELTIAVVPQENSNNILRPGVVQEKGFHENLVKRGIIHSGEVTDFSELKTTYPNTEILDKQNIPYVLGRDVDWQAQQFDLVVYGYPYEKVMYPAFHMSEIKKYCRKVIYLPYGIDISTGPTVEKQSYSQPIHTQADAFFYPSEAARQKFITARPGMADKIFATSTPRFDRLYRIKEHPIDPVLQEKVGNRFCVLINHHFTFYINRWSTFDFTFADFFDFFVANQDRFACIWRPHPNIDRMLISCGFFTSSHMKKINSAIESAGIIVDRSANHIDAFALSDCFITDTSSMFVDYIGTGKPMILQHNPQGFHTYDKYDLELMNCYYQGENAADAIAFVENIYAGKDPKKVMRTLAQKRFVSKFDGQATERIYQKIKELILN